MKILQDSAAQLPPAELQPITPLALKVLKAPVMREAIGDVIDYSSVSDPSPLEFFYPGLEQEIPDLLYIGVILHANGSGSGFTLWARDALAPTTLTKQVDKRLYSPSNGLRVRGSLTFFYKDGKQLKIDIPEKNYRVSQEWEAGQDAGPMNAANALPLPRIVPPYLSGSGVTEGRVDYSQLGESVRFIVEYPGHSGLVGLTSFEMHSWLEAGESQKRESSQAATPEASAFSLVATLDKASLNSNVAMMYQKIFYTFEDGMKATIESATRAYVVENRSADQP